MRTPKSILAAFACLLTGIASAQYSIGWWKVAGGGGTSTGGLYTVSATIGQHEAGAMSGGPFSLTGGFWAAAVQTPGAPTLSITPAGSGQATLTWTPDIPGFYVQVSDALVPSAWTNAPSGTNQPVTIPTTGPMKFYRLAHP